mmetsp:Transcript_32902/g.84959  ORF Transcript_32902/g.84959 Transcript_32902/m.84959 type:complete len:356 (-) Transcript_32902:178-1245(-)|eukprot:CAMPEP_0113904946 /NCGR_PEP_ID=MMETSP0780_2-20120614/23647_1 /TAXON_ID=652834 /ORGANISM="Palpitomonas bilix" /LENGTH=355 /DNA_ID=CAMNT_0000898837 /DNA_START=169 /DNA_END=1236 /DNA_ORIENTATION=- /assembly_acc=CAM_ASM_000599
MSLKQPVGQVRFTNVAAVKLRKKGKRFEIACYKNKVLNWRTGVEKDIDEVLHTDSIFTNLSRAQLAKDGDLLEVFGTNDKLAICKIILDKGEVQVSDKEREFSLQSKMKDIATIIAEKCVDPTTKRPYPVSMIEKAMKEIHYSASESRPSKQQALEVIKQLIEAQFPIQRAEMRLRISVDLSGEGELKRAVKEMGATIESDDQQKKYNCVMTVDPGHYRKLEEFVRENSYMRGALEVLDLSVQSAGGAIANEVPTAESAASQRAYANSRQIETKVNRGGEGGGRAGGGAAPPRSLTCNTCRLSFESRKEQGDHMRSEWHSENLRRKVAKEGPLTREEFDDMKAKEKPRDEGDIYA